MAKKTAGDFVMAAEIRKLLEKVPTLTGAEVYATLCRQFPGRKINQSSCGVAFSVARKQLGISANSKPGRKTTVRKKKVGTVVRRKKPAAAAAVDLAALEAAAKYLARVGDAETAVEAVRQLQRLQIG